MILFELKASPPARPCENVSGDERLVKSCPKHSEGILPSRYTAKQEPFMEKGF
jgi:hypothetical protein